MLRLVFLLQMVVFKPPAGCAIPRSTLPKQSIVIRAPGDICERTVDISEKAFYTLGRRGADVMLYSKSASRAHAVIFHTSSGDAFLVDLGSKQGTYIHDYRLEPNKAHPWKEGIVITFGPPGDEGERAWLVSRGELPIRAPQKQQEQHNHVDIQPHLEVPPVAESALAQVLARSSAAEPWLSPTRSFKSEWQQISEQPQGGLASAVSSSAPLKAQPWATGPAGASAAGWQRKDDPASRIGEPALKRQKVLSISTAPAPAVERSSDTRLSAPHRFHPVGETYMVETQMAGLRKASELWTHTPEVAAR